MILSNFKVFPRTGRLIGIDWGARRTGVAVSCADGMIVSVRPAISMSKYNHQELAAHIVQIAKDERVSGIVIGLPLRTDETESETTKTVREFADVLAAATDIPIIFIDETLSSAAAQEEMGRVRPRDIKEKLDSNAARVILENAIAMLNRSF
ncbi:MAG: Holliday junction resolvase RuvX [Alphaproteobacteria bacterium]|nr:Holliday junction resolvase RuvX [Alphaproteobacteria bacterium]